MNSPETPLPTDEYEHGLLRQAQGVVHNVLIGNKPAATLGPLARALEMTVFNRTQYQEAADSMARNIRGLLRDVEDDESVRRRWRYKMLHLARRWRHRPKAARKLRRIVWTTTT